MESGAREEGAALGALRLEAQLLKGQLITQAGQTGWEPHKHKVKCVKGREAGKGRVLALNLKPEGEGPWEGLHCTQTGLWASAPPSQVQTAAYGKALLCP